MENFYYFLAAISYGIFIIQFLLSWIGGHVDIDVDMDGHADFDINDVVSFKGLIHLLMGFSGWTASQQYFNGEVSKADVAIGIGCGIALMFILYFLYKLCMKLQYIPKGEDREALIGRIGVVYMVLPNDRYVINITVNGASTEIEAQSLYPNSDFKVGKMVNVIDYKNGEYFIH